MKRNSITSIIAVGLLQAFGSDASFAQVPNKTGTQLESTPEISTGLGGFRGLDDSVGHFVSPFRWFWQNFSVAFHVENDSILPFYGFNPISSDSSYTNGLRLEISTRLFDYKKTDLISDFWGLAIGQNMYTPRNIARTDIVWNERPYAGWLYAGGTLTRASRSNEKLLYPDQLIKLELDAGWLGEGLAGVAQRWWHAQPFINAQRPNGWDHHVSDELGLRLALDWRKELMSTSLNQAFPDLNNEFSKLGIYNNLANKKMLDVWFNTGAEVGNVFTGTSVGAIARAGLFEQSPSGGGDAITPFKFDVNQLPSDSEKQRTAIQSVAQSDIDLAFNPVSQGVFSLLDKIDVYLFARNTQQLNLVNGTIQGGIISAVTGRPSPHSLPLRPFTPSGDAGLHIGFGRAFIETSFSFKGPEINTPDADPLGQRFWRLNVGTYFR